MGGGREEEQEVEGGAAAIAVPTPTPTPTKQPMAATALRQRQAALHLQDPDEEDVSTAAVGGAADASQPESKSTPTAALRSPAFTAKVVLSPAQQRRLWWAGEERRRSPRSPHYWRVQRGRRPWAVFWAVSLILLVLALPLLQTWRRLWVAHRIGMEAALVCVVSHFFPLIDHTDDFIDPENLATSRRRLDLANYYTNLAPAIQGTEDVFVPSSKGNHSIPLRLYRPLATGRGGAGGDPPSKVLVWIHGGGWTIGSIESDDKIARRLAAATGAVVASVEYRLAPEFKYPAQVEDTLDALEFLLENGGDLGLDTSKVAVAGESAGGHLTIVTAMALKSAKTRLCAILPVVPATDYGCATPSCDRFNNGYLLTQGQVRAFWHAKLSDPDTEQHDFLVSPLRAPQEMFEDLPPMLVMTAALDPLRDEGEAFVDRAREAGAVADLIRFEHTIHGFFGRLVTGGAGGIAQAAEWLDRTCEWGVGDDGEKPQRAARTRRVGRCPRRSNRGCVCL